MADSHNFQTENNQAISHAICGYNCGWWWPVVIQFCWDHPLTLGQVSGSTKGRAGHKKNIEWRLRGNHKRTGLEPLGVYCPSYIPTGLWPCWSTGNISLVDKEPFTLWCASLSHHYFVTSILGSHRYLLKKLSCETAQFDERIILARQIFNWVKIEGDQKCPSYYTWPHSKLGYY